MENKTEMTFEFDGKNFEAKDIRSQGGLKREIVELVRHAPTPDRECETTDFLMALQAILDRHAQREEKGTIKSAIEELPASPFIDADIIDFIEQNSHVDSRQYGYRVVADDYKNLAARLIEILKNHML